MEPKPKAQIGKYRSNKKLLHQINKQKLNDEQKAQIEGIASKFIELLQVLIFAVTRFVSTIFFASLVGIDIDITSSEIALKLRVITAGIEKYNYIIKKKNDEKIVLLRKTKLNSIEVLISRDLVDSFISYDDFLLVNNLIKEYSDMYVMKEVNKVIKNLKIVKFYSRF